MAYIGGGLVGDAALAALAAPTQGSSNGVLERVVARIPALLIGGEGSGQDARHDAAFDTLVGVLRARVDHFLREADLHALRKDHAPATADASQTTGALGDEIDPAARE